MTENHLPQPQTTNASVARPAPSLLERLSTAGDRPTIHSPWYEPGKDFFFYAGAQDACRASRARLKKLKLSEDEERLVAAAPRDLDEVISRLKVIQEEQERAARKSTLQKRSSSIVNGFCDVAVKTSAIVEILLPQSPEYTVTYGLLLILFKSVVTKKEREESLSTYLQNLVSQLPLADFYRSTFPTNAMKLAVANIFVQIMKLLDEALVYYRSGRLSKLMDAVLQPTDNKFDAYIANIEAEVKKMNELKDAAHVAQTTDIKEVVEGTGKVVALLYENFERSATAVGIRMEMLNEKLDGLETKMNEMLNFEMVQYSQALREAILAEGWDSEEELDMVLHRGFRLSPKDQWENNGILDELLTWPKHGRSSLLWIGGKSGNQDTWVTELSADIVQALKPQLLTLLYVFCDGASRTLSPIRLVKGLIIQLLALHPKLAYQNPESCNPWRFKKSVAFGQVWRIFEQLALKVPDLFIIIDRVEECEADEQADLKNQLLPSLMRFVERPPGASVIVTSVFDPPLELRSNPVLQDVYIDTTKRAHKRD